MTALRGEPARRLDAGPSWRDYRDAVERYYAEGWTDGLPIVPPTEEEVAALVAVTGRDPLEVLGEVPPRRGLATIETVATCAVMAGCLPEHFPVVVTGIEAVLEPRFNLNGLQSTGNGATPLCIVSGPAVDALGMNYGTNLFGYGSRANATIGRALRLVLLLQGGAIPDIGTKSAMGSPARYSFCIAEAPAAPGGLLHNPWGPVHATLGLADAVNAVTMVGANAPVNVWAGWGRYDKDRFVAGLAEELAKMAMITQGTQLTIVINPFAARAVADDWGWDRPTFTSEMYARAHDARERLARALPVTGSVEQWFAGPESFVVVVAGGAQFPTVCALLSGWLMGGAWAISKPLPE